MLRHVTRHGSLRPHSLLSICATSSPICHTPGHELSSSSHRRFSMTRPSSSSSTTTEVAAPGPGPNHRSVMSLDGNSIRPHVQPNAYVAPSATVIGSVAVNDKAMLGYGSVIRGDLALIHIGFSSIIGDNCVLSAGEIISEPSSGGGEQRRSRYNLSPSQAIATGLTLEPELVIGDFCVIGPNSSLTGCFLDGDNQIGANCRVEQGARLARYTALAAGSRLTQGTQTGEGEVWAGNPAVKVASIEPDSLMPRRTEVMAKSAVVEEHAAEFLPVGSVYWEKEELAKKKMQ